MPLAKPPFPMDKPGLPGHVCAEDSEETLENQLFSMLTARPTVSLKVSNSKMRSESARTDLTQVPPDQDACRGSAACSHARLHWRRALTCL